MLPNLHNIQESLREPIRTYYKEDLLSVEISSTINRPYSSVYFLIVATKNRTLQLVLKQIVHHSINSQITLKENQAVVEYNILSQLHAGFQAVPGCAVPKPILVLPEAESYIMEFVPGCLLVENFRFTRLLSAKNGFQELREHVSLCGRWLKHFHSLTGMRHAGLESLCDTMGRAKHRLSLIAELRHPKVPTSFAKEVTDLLSRQCTALQGQNIIVTGRHSDFTPFNVIAAPHQVTVIDFLGYQMDPVPVDILKFLVFLDDEARSLTAQKGRVDELRSAFLDGYGELPSVPRALVTLCEAMQRIVSLYGHLSPSQRIWHHRIENQITVKAHIKWLVGTKEKDLLWPGTLHTTTSGDEMRFLP